MARSAVATGRRDGEDSTSSPDVEGNDARWRQRHSDEVHRRCCDVLSSRTEQTDERIRNGHTYSAAAADLRGYGLACRCPRRLRAPSTPASSPARTPQLACVLGATAQPIDTVGLTLSCTVTHAPASESAFTAHDTFVNKAGQSHTLAPACHGALVGGSGHCMQSYSVPAPFLLTNGTVTGSTQPHNYSLGPVSPTVRQPSPAQTPSLPLGPLATPTPLGAPQG